MAPTLTCVDNRQVLAAGPTLTLFPLPRLQKVLSTPISTKESKNHAFVPGVVVTADSLTYVVQASNKIATVALPRAQQR